MVVERPGTDQDGSLPVTITVTSLHSLYPINIIVLRTTLVNEDGVLCCQLNRKDWGVDFYTTRKIGPGYSYSASSVFSVPEGKRVWLLGQLRVEEESSSKIEAEASFVVELP